MNSQPDLLSPDIRAAALDLSEQDHIDAKVEDAIRNTESTFRPEPTYLVDRYYSSRAAYISALERQAEFDREEVAAASAEAPVTWRLSRLLNAAVCATKARLERSAIANQEDQS